MSDTESYYDSDSENESYNVCKVINIINFDLNYNVVTFINNTFNENEENDFYKVLLTVYVNGEYKQTEEYITYSDTDKILSYFKQFNAKHLKYDFNMYFDFMFDDVKLVNFWKLLSLNDKKAAIKHVLKHKKIKTPPLFVLSYLAADNLDDNIRDDVEKQIEELLI